MANFKSADDFSNFERRVKTHRRYILTEMEREFLEAVKETSADRRVTIPRGSRLWRAQLGCDFDEVNGVPFCPTAYSPNRMKPMSTKAREGRINPKGIPCLYVATDRDTALSEVRPWIGSHVSLGLFEIVRDLAVIDCSKYHGQIGGSIGLLFETPLRTGEVLDDGKGEGPFKEVGEDESTSERETITKFIWIDIDNAFSQPVTMKDDIADYAPTQILAEAFKEMSFDGIVYKSDLNENGYNIAIFDVDAANILKCEIHSVKKVKFEHNEVGSPWFIGK